MEPIRIVIVDDQDMVRSGLEIFFETCDDLELIGAAANRDEAVALCQKLQPDVVLMDLMLSGKPEGIVASRILREMIPDIKIIVLSSFCTLELIEEVFEAGVTSYLFKNISIDELANAIRGVHMGKSAISSEVARILKQAGKTLPPSL